MQNENIFLKIKNSEERSTLYEQLLKNKSTILAKSQRPSQVAVVLIPYSLLKDRILVKVQGVLSLKKNEKLILQFVVGQEKYITLSQFEHSGNDLAIIPSDELFKIQRRDDFRVKLPKSFNAKFLVTKHNSTASQQQLSVTNISAGGCQIETEISAFPLKLHDTLSGEITMSKRPNIQITAEVKHLAANPVDPKKQCIGIQFLNIQEIEKNRLVSVVLDLYKELFSKY